ncbi:hypothetical protein C7974DRAFT_90183 [Boeremia exigua]|uniref:uncharacterized protein n=1 Tax=Boeremia exigua TaxID=749465 RepID=UPI001E8CA394|nr:uncharacterized protein C7974DRAFT_90183 [Boeremia exigua]KAH6612040.1 hypothetical protein C7974DRAFT_90183 [Boeremia exigua]
MVHPTVTLLFAALASAQASNYTTTAWMTNFAGSDKYGYVASVINADAEHMTLSLDYDADADRDALHVGGPAGNFTFGPSGFTLSTERRSVMGGPSGNMGLQVECTEPARVDAEVTCTGTFGDGYARYARCNEYETTQTRRTPRENMTTSYAHTYGTGLWGSGGTETITQTFNYPLVSETTTPAWCTSDELPESAVSTAFPASATKFAVYQIVIYAGQEKLSAFSGSSAVNSTGPSSTESGPAATASAGTNGTTSTPPESTGAADKMNAAVPVIAGLGVAAVMGML